MSTKQRNDFRQSGFLREEINKKREETTTIYARHYYLTETGEKDEVER